jgi:putative thioredoxin
MYLVESLAPKAPRKRQAGASPAFAEDAPAKTFGRNGTKIVDQLIGAGGAQAGAAIKNATTATFMADVVDASMDHPIIVDFWAPWCGPCKQLTPILEKLVKATNGAVQMVKVNIDESPEIAQQMRVQSIPAVFAFRDGRPVDGFVGSLPESQIKAFIQRLGGKAGPSAIEEAVEMARGALADGDGGAAANIFAQVLQREPENLAALTGLARCALAENDPEQAREILARVPAAQAKHADVAAVAAAIELAEAGAKAAGAAGELEARLALDPNDHDARLALATALFAGGDRERAIDALLALVKLDREWNEQAARKQLVKFFEAMGPMDPLTVAARKRLSSILFS